MRKLCLWVALLLLAASPSAAQAPDALHNRALTLLDDWHQWLEDNDVRGFVGEFGWPDDDDGQQDSEQWNELAEAYLSRLDQHELSGGVWATGEWWPPEYCCAVYYDHDTDVDAGVDTPNTQAPVLEAHLSAGDYFRAIDVSTGGFCEPGPLDRTSDFSNRNVGRYDRCYQYDHRPTYEYLAGRGIDTVKIEFRWENVQRDLGGRLHKREMKRLTRSVEAARDSGLEVILTMHNFGAYWLFDGEVGVRRPVGSKLVPIAHFADVWSRLSRRFGDDAGVFYATMCEPVRMKGRTKMSAAKVWETASQAALDAIRATGDNKTVFVSGYRWAGIEHWAEVHPASWIDDPADNFYYEAHHYWDSDASGTYPNSYEEEVELAESLGW